MAFEIFLFKYFASKNDKKRDKGFVIPEGLDSTYDIPFFTYRKKQYCFEIHSPKGQRHECPILVMIHGGAWVYGDRKLYRPYATSLAKRGFTVVSFDYPYASRHCRFPTHLGCIDALMEFLKDNHEKYNLNINRLFMVGDSAGANMAAQYAAISTNEKYRALFGYKCPIAIKGLLLNSGLYQNLFELPEKLRDNFVKFYLPKDAKSDDPRLEILGNITNAFPPSYILTADKDFLNTEAPILDKKLTEVGVRHVYEEYKSGEGVELGHVFNLDTREKNAVEATDKEAAFLLLI